MKGITLACIGVCVALAGTSGTTLAERLPPIVESTPLGGGALPAAPSSRPGMPAASQPSAPRPPVTAAVKSKMSLEERVARLERMVESRALMEILMQLEALQQAVQEIRGDSEVQGHQIEGVKQRQRELYLDIDRRLREMEVTLANAFSRQPEGADMATPDVAAAAVAGTGASAVTPPPQPDAAVVQSQQDALEETKAYEQAFNVLKEGRYEDAIDAFHKFLARYPKGQYSDNAQYWLAEANYVLRRFDTAIEEFQKVLKQFPDSTKIPDAMLKTGYSYYELKKWEEARKMLNALVKRWPDTTAGQLAKNRLHRMKLEGR